MADYCSINTDECFKLLKTSKKGLTSAEAKQRLKDYGHNELAKEKDLRAIKIFIGQFKNALLLLLLGAGLLSLILSETIEAIAIFGILLLNAVLGFIQEYRAQKEMEALKKLSSPFARVLRNGKESRILAKELVPGDVLIIEAGDIIPADSRLFLVSSLQVNEASLTGESVPSKKAVSTLAIKTSLADQENMVFMGTAVTYGKAKAIVTKTGMRTEFGKIATSLQEIEEVPTPLQMKFSRLAKQIGIIAVSLILTVFAIGLMRGTLTLGRMILFALALTVSTVPNSLPIIVTVGLSLGAKRLAGSNMLIKKLPAAESLGAATVIVSDKTGTITKNEMTVTEMFCNNTVFTVSGSGYEITGNFYEKDKQVSPKQFETLMRIGYLCNSASLIKNDGKPVILGDPTEGSLLVLAKKAQISEEKISKNFSFLQELPFDSDRKRMSVIFKNKLNHNIEAYVKGAPDLLLNACSKIYENGRTRKITSKDRKKIHEMNCHFAGKALRVLALAYRDLSGIKKYSVKSVEKNLVFVGLVGMIDPPREEVKLAVQQCQEAGIKVMVITGDHALTAQAVAKEIGLFKKGDIVLTGEDIQKMSDAELRKKIDSIRIIARAMPIQKSRVVEALQKQGHIVAMTGDGVNDAPALKKADIGIAMGITGTDVAKDVAEATLLDDNFASIVNAVREGRNIYDKMVKSAKYLLSCNTGEITAVFMAIMLKFPLPLLPLQILLMNLLTDDFPALGLGFESYETNIMKRSPRNPKENPLTKRILMSILIFGAIMGAGTLFLFSRYTSISLGKAQTIAFTTLVMFQMFAVLSSRSLGHSLKHLNPFSNMWLFGAVCLSLLIQVFVIYLPPLQIIFGTVPLLAIDWAKIIGVSSIGFVMMELSKSFIIK
ncbi:MAG: cation-transporting P-type ATPase [archaeon]